MPPAAKKKVVVIGAGAAGVFTAYLLKKKAPDYFDVTILEKGPAVGGHTISHSVTDGTETVNIDGGAQFFSETVQPQYCDMLRDEGFFDAPSPIIQRDVGVTVWNATDGELLFRVPDNLPEILDKVDENPLDWLNFLILSVAAIEHYAFGGWDETFGAWLDKIPFLLFPNEKAAFKANIARPLMYQFGLVEPSRLDDLSAKFVVYYYVGSLPWEGGDAPFRLYNSTIGLDGILEQLLTNYGLDENRHVNAEVLSLARKGDGYEVTVAGGATFDADEIVFATNPQWTKDLLPPDSDFDPVRDLLTGMEYVSVPIHMQYTDTPSHMPGAEWSASNVLKVDDSFGDPTHYMLSVWFGPLRDEALAGECFKSWGSPDRVPPNAPSDRMQLHRLMVGTPDFIARRKTLRDSHQGEHHLWYSGGYSIDYDCQNACLKSASLVASALIQEALLQEVASATGGLIQPLQVAPAEPAAFLPEPQFREWPPLLYAIEGRLRRAHNGHEAVSAWLDTRKGR